MMPQQRRTSSHLHLAPKIIRQPLLNCSQQPLRSQSKAAVTTNHHSRHDGNQRQQSPPPVQKLQVLQTHNRFEPLLSSRGRVVCHWYHTGLSDPDAAPTYPAQLAAVLLLSFTSCHPCDHQAGVHLHHSYALCVITKQYTTDLVRLSGALYIVRGIIMKMTQFRFWG